MAQRERVPPGTRERIAKRKELVAAAVGALALAALFVFLFIVLPLIVPPGISVP